MHRIIAAANDTNDVLKTPVFSAPVTRRPARPSRARPRSLDRCRALRGWAAIVIVAMAVGALGCRTRISEAPLSNLILITIDALRRDRLGLYGYDAPTSRALDALARESLVYDTAYSHASWTPPSHASLLTGKLPPEHGLRDLFVGRLSEREVTLAEVLRQGGVATAAFVSAVPLRREVGLDQGFDVYDDAELTAESSRTERGADETTDVAIAWMKDHAGRRFFVWIHYFDPHTPYEEQEGYDAAAEEAGVRVPPKGSMLRWKHKYDAEIYFVDGQIGRLVEFLHEMDLRDDTGLIVTSDHGEYMGERKLLGHSGVYETVLRVPLIVFDPRRAQQPGRVPDVVRHIDVFPTVLSLLGASVPPTPNAEILPPYGTTEGDRPRPVYAEHTKTGSYGLREGPWKLVTRGWAADGQPEHVELYNLDEDPEEHVDLSADHPERRTAMLDRLATERVARPDTETVHQRPDESTAEKLRALGYTE
jgi:arylsulfatase A-like enzyme